ncbi:membrane dipeptidase [Ralstonia sp. UNC404CL21Col]|uniref:dipeptidase n=1 Tax=Ralstonia sp. UNC404CL21Col TaxID=1380362 RepID=UPI000AD262B2|nr:membrane dipeptidase [Ralstonia sp. UNC404CL21Col]
MLIDWSLIATREADALHDTIVDVEGWAMPLDAAAQSADYFLLSAEAPCCGGCVSRNPAASIEVFAAQPMPVGDVTRVRGRLVRLHDDPAGWRYQLVDAALSPGQPAAGSPRISRRVFLAAGAAMGLAACAPGRFANYTDAPSEASSMWAPPAGTLTVDMHSHAGRVTVSRDPKIGANRPFLPVAEPMRAGGMQVICLAIVTDTTAVHVGAGGNRFEAFRTPEPGELYQLGMTEFARAQRLIEREQLHVVTDAASLAAMGTQGPSVIIASEGADFLEGRIERVDEAYTQHRLRHLQLTHYRVNELGDIQTEPPVHGGLTDFGADVVRRCNALGIVVDVAHGTYDLVKRAAATTTKPLVLSHTALSRAPRSRSRLISADHARAVAETGGVIGVWPNAADFPNLDAMALGIKRMADVVGVAHVGLGTDMLGFIRPPVFTGYAQLPALATALLKAGFTSGEVGQILGGNYRRVFEATVG